MEKPPPFQRCRWFAYECRWLIRSEWRLPFFAGIAVVVGSFLWARHANKPAIFSNSGAVMTITGLLMTIRPALRGMGDAYMRETGAADRRAFRPRLHPIVEREQAAKDDSRAFRWGIASIAIGTLLWGYGEVIWNAL